MRAPLRARLPWIGAALIALLALALAVGYLRGKPEALADSYREANEPRAREINRAMDAVYTSFDDYLEHSHLPPGRLKDLDNFDELKRRLLPVQRETERALNRARKRIARAEETIDEHEAALGEIPGAVIASAPEQVDATAEEAADYVRRSRRFLKSYAAYAKYARKVNKLDRRALLAISNSGLEEADGPDEFRTVLKELRSEFAGQRRTLERIKAHPDAEKLHETSRDLNDATVDFFDDLQRAVDAADLLGLVRAEVQFFRANLRLGNKYQRRLDEFRRQSGLQRATRALTDRANSLEEAVAGLGSGTPETDRPKSWKRPPLPKPSTPDSGRKGESDKRLT